MDAFKKQLINFLKGQFLKAAIKKILGSAAAGGFKAWIVRYILTELFEEVAEPLIKYALRKGQLIYDKAAGEIRIKKIEKAKEEGNEDDYTSSIGRV